MRYLAARLLSGLVMVFALLLVTFALFWLIPQDPWRAIITDPLAHPTQAEKDAAEHQLGVDRPVIVQFGKYAWGILRHGDFGRSFYASQPPVTDTLKRALPVTWSIVLGGALLLFLLAVPLGTLSALRENTWVDRTILTASIAGVALHPFIIGIGLRWGLADKLGWLPAHTYCPLRGTAYIPCETEGGQCLGFDQPTPCGGARDWALHLALPWLTFAVIFLPLYMRMIRSSVLDVLEQPYVLTARAKGAGSLRLLRTHVLRNALLQPLTLIGMEIGLALTVSIYLEVIFNFRGVGKEAITALGFGSGTVTGDPSGVGGITSGGYFDLPNIAGIVFMIAMTVVILNLLVDIAYAVLDPRIKLGTAATAAG